MKSWLNTYSGIFLFLFGSCSTQLPEEVALEYYQLPQNVDFNIHVKPILSDKCYACHGPDNAKREANLRLDIAENAYEKLANHPHKTAIKPGSLKGSELFHRILSSEADYMMPPPTAHLDLTNQEKAILIKWIEEGAEYKPHWAFMKPKKENLPNLKKEDGIINPIDLFVGQELEEEGLSFSKTATKETLIRRASFDLTGLPPTLSEIDAFVTDTSANAYELLLNRLLSSKAYGERMAADWMEVARFADSDGYLDDKHRDFTPWRDWVIHAFNKNLSYEQFVTWQLAGDLIDNPTQETVLAIAFNRLNKRNSEAGIVFEEFRVEYQADRTNTLGTAFMGLSVECARCHDHKYDPISQKNYYELFGFFNSTFEIGHAVYGPGQTPGPALLLATQKEQSEMDSLRNFIGKLTSKLEHQNTAALFENWKKQHQITEPSLSDGIEKSLVAHYPFDKFKRKKGKITQSPAQNASAKPAKLKQAIIKDGISGKAFFVNDYNNAVLGEKVGWYDRTEPFSIQLWLYPDTIYKETNMFWHCESLRLGQKGYTLGLKDNKLVFSIAHSWPQNAVQVHSEQALAVKEWSQITITYDGSSQAKGIQLYINGEQQNTQIDYDHLYRSILFEPDIHTYGFQGIIIGARDKYIPFKNGGIDEIKVFDRALVPLEVLFSYNPTKAMEWVQEKALLLPYYKAHFAPIDKQLNASLKNAKTAENNLVSGIKEIMVMGDLPKPRPTFVLNRGINNAKGETVEPSAPESILPFDKTLPKNRLGLTKWLFNKNNPLTARVYVNRIWQMHFGRGLVKTAEDFGNQGELPTHPKLLDWLAIQFMESGWDIKALHQLILMSKTYRQSSAISNELLEKDPENNLLARGPRFRLPAEMIRDNALKISGLLVNDIGGESVYPYQPAGIWDGLTNKHWAYKYLQEPGEGLYRRSLYSIWKRTAPPPSMLIFDMADRSTCTVRRTTTSTPLQALVLLNDPQYVEAARILAERLVKEEPTVNNQLIKAFRVITGRHPTEAELKILSAFYQEELAHFYQNPQAALDLLAIGAKEWDKQLNPAEITALSVLINSVMNTDEGYTRK